MRSPPPHPLRHPRLLGEGDGTSAHECDAIAQKLCVLERARAALQRVTRHELRAQVRGGRALFLLRLREA